MIDILSPAALRQSIRSGAHSGNTSGLAAGFVQCNIVILPAAWANDFLRFCQLNPRPCPLIATSMSPGEFTLPLLGDVDIRTDVPSYRMFRDGEFIEEVSDITALWQDDLVTFALGCSYIDTAFWRSANDSILFNWYYVDGCKYRNAEIKESGSGAC